MESTKRKTSTCVGLASTALIIPINLTDTIASEQDESLLKTGWGESTSWWVEQLLLRSLPGREQGEASFGVWEQVIDDQSASSNPLISNQLKNRKTSVRLRLSKTCLKCLFGEESSLSLFTSVSSPAFYQR